MDYSIGSLSDLITGSVTPNKKKVIKKQITAKKSTETSPVSNNDVQSTDFRPKKKVKKSKLIKNENATLNGSSGGNLIKVPKQETPSTADENVEKLKKVSKKRKLIERGESEPTAKKGKNAQNAERRVASKEVAPKIEEDPEVLSRTVFVGNLPITLTNQKFKRMFLKFGKIESVRIRGAPIADPKVPKKVSIIKKKFHPDRKSFYGFVRFEERDHAIKATEANGLLFQDHHLRVHLCDIKDKPDENKAIFVGNLSFYAEEEELWKTFESCGQIESVRIVRDQKTNIGKGFGYVNFRNSDSVTLAMEMENIKIKERELRISVCNNNAAKKNPKMNKVKQITKQRNLKSPKKEPAGNRASPGKQRVKKEPLVDGQETPESNDKADNKSFQGVKFVQKKKKKFNKGLMEKKKMVKQLAPK